MLNKMKWDHEPDFFEIKDECLNLKTKLETDFWQKTYYGFIRDDGHFYHLNLSGNFSIEVDLVGDYQNLYDQMGIMVKIDDKRWIKTGIEYTDDKLHLSCVVTNDYSDWSVIEYSKVNKKIRLKLIKIEDFVVIKYLKEDLTWQMLRLCHIDNVETYKVGLMACSPTSDNFSACFKNLEIIENIKKEDFKLHG